MNSTPLRTSVVVPAHNAKRTIGLCVDALLRQTRLPNAIYIADNGSTDGTYEWLLERATQEPRLHVLREMTPGAPAARNAALRVIEEGLVAFTDADCVPEPQWLANLAAVYADPAVTAAAGSIVGYQPCTLVDRYLSIIGFSLSERPSVVRRCAPFVGFPTANLSARIDVLRRIGEFDGRMWPAEDYDLCWRMLRAGDVIIYAPEARVGHIHRATLGAMLKRMFEYGAARPKLIRKHFPGIAYAAIGRRNVEMRAPVTVCINLTSPEKVSLILIGLSVVSPWFLGLLAVYWTRLALRLNQAARGQGFNVRPGGLILLTALHLLEFCASGAGSAIASLRYGVLCV